MGIQLLWFPILFHVHDAKSCLHWKGRQKKYDSCPPLRCLHKNVLLFCWFSALQIVVTETSSQVVPSKPVTDDTWPWSAPHSLNRLDFQRTPTFLRNEIVLKGCKFILHSRVPQHFNVARRFTRYSCHIKFCEIHYMCNKTSGIYSKSNNVIHDWQTNSIWILIS